MDGRIQDDVKAATLFQGRTQGLGDQKWKTQIPSPSGFQRGKIPSAERLFLECRRNHHGLMQVDPCFAKAYQICHYRRSETRIIRIPLECAYPDLL